MRVYIIILAFFGIIYLSSCDPNECMEPPVEETSFGGDYCLVQHYGGFGGLFNTFLPATITYSFDEANGELTVLNTISDSISFSGLASGVYDYGIIQSGNNEILVIDGQEWGGITFEDDLVYVDEGVSSIGEVSDQFGWTLSSNCATTEVWNLVNISGGFAGINEEFDPGIITWTIDFDNNMLEVVNNNVETVIYDGFPTGSYVFTISYPGNAPYIIVNELDLGELSYSNGDLYINGIESTQPIADGFVYHLTSQ